MYIAIAAIIAPEKTVAADVLEIYHDTREISGCRLTVLEDWILDRNGAACSIQVKNRDFLLQAIELQIVLETVFQELLRKQKSGKRERYTFFLSPHDRLSGFRASTIKNGCIVEVSPLEVRANVKVFAEKFFIRHLIGHLHPGRHISLENGD